MAVVERLGSRQVYANSWMTVREDDIRRADGSAGIYGVVDKPDYALVIAVRGDQVHLVEQYRYPLGLRRWEFPQGTAPNRADSDPAGLAARELREETGLRAGRLTQIGLLDVAPGMSSQRGRVFVATDVTDGRPEREPEEQDMRSAWFTRSAVEAMITRGELTDAQSIAAYGLLLLQERTADQPVNAVWQARNDSVE
ncbi:MAG TPA: NUDIX hydrolase [Pseudonocardiaceae bacterium]|nr:NUDIX hydrolase [Pseudonocardiaceae bacterium]